MARAPEKTPPRYEWLKQVLRAAIERGTYAAGGALPRLDELTALYGVSAITVRRALQDLAREGLLQRKPRVGTVVAASRRPPRVALVLLGYHEVEKWRERSKIFGDLMAGVGEVAWESWGNLSVSRVADCEAARRQLQEMRSRGEVDGVLFKPGDADLFPDMIDPLGLPYVVIKRAPRGAQVNCVLGDDFAEARQLTAHLVDRGYKHIGFIGPPSPDLYRLRHGGYAAALKEAGSARDPALVVQASDYEVSHADRWVDLLLSARTRPDAVFCGLGTLVAGRVIQALAARGLRVPQDLGFVMHDPDESGESFQPPVTSAGASNFDLGRSGARMLDDLLKNPARKPVKLTLPAHVVIRASTPGRAATRKSGTPVGGRLVRVR